MSATSSGSGSPSPQARSTPNTSAYAPTPEAELRSSRTKDSTGSVPPQGGDVPGRVDLAEEVGEEDLHRLGAAREDRQPAVHLADEDEAVALLRLEGPAHLAVGDGGLDRHRAGEGLGHVVGDVGGAHGVAGGHDLLEERGAVLERAVARL